MFHDLVGLTMGHKPKFARQYVNLSAEITRAATEFCNDVQNGSFPSDAESYHSPAELRQNYWHANAPNRQLGSVVRWPLRWFL